MELEAAFGSAVQNGLSLAAQMESMLLNPEEIIGKMMNRAGTSFAMPRASPKDHIESLLLMAQIQGLQSDWIGMKSTLLDIVSLYGDDISTQHQWEILLDLSRSSYKLGEFREAIGFGLEAIALDRKYPGCHHFVVLAYLASPNKHREAQQCAAEAVIYETPWDEVHHAVTKKFYREHFLR